MTFPIVIGTKAVSSFPVSAANHVEEYTDDRKTILVPALIDFENAENCIVSIAEISGNYIEGNNNNNNNVEDISQHDLQAVATVRYYDMLRLDNGDCEYTVVDIRIQVAPLGESFSSTKYRELVHRLRLPQPVECVGVSVVSVHNDVSTSSSCTNQPTNTDKSLSLPIVYTDLKFSSDRRFLTLLIPHRSNLSKRDNILENQSLTIVFQLRAPQPDSRQDLSPPLPSYLKKSSISSSKLSKSTETRVNNTSASTVFKKVVVPVATNPKIIHMFEDTQFDDKYDRKINRRYMLYTFSFCNVSSSKLTPSDTSTLSSNSYVILGCMDGSVRIASLRTAVVRNELLYKNHDHCCITAVDHVIADMNEKNILVGRLVLLFGNCTVRVFQSRIDVTKNTNMITLQETHSFGFNASGSVAELNINDARKFFIAVKLLSSSFLALASIQQSSKHYKWNDTPTSTTVEVVRLYDEGNFCRMSEIELSADRLIENAHTSSTVATNLYRKYLKSPKKNANSTMGTQQSMSITYSKSIDCLALSSYVKSTSKSSSPFHFACVWHWRSNTQGLTITSSVDDRNSLLLESRAMNNIHCFRLCFANDAFCGMKIVHFLSWSSNVFEQVHVRKEVYNMGLLSPPQDISSVRTGCLERTCSLFVSGNTIAYPHVTRISTRESYELEWMESMIPKSYLELNGKPLCATIGDKMGRSIAVACSRGVCILNCYDRIQEESLLYRSAENNLLKPDNDEPCMRNVLNPSTSCPRWHLFSNETIEQSFRVVAMSWWESSVPLRKENNFETEHRDDVLIAVIEVCSGDGQGYYLSGWSSRNLSLDSQVLVDSSELYSASVVPCRTAWGVSIPSDFHPDTLDLLSLHQKCSQGKLKDGTRKASVLLTDRRCRQNGFRLYCLQVIQGPSTQYRKGPDSKNFEVVVHMLLSDAIGSPADLFLASSSIFVQNFDPSKSKNQSLSPPNIDFCITIGVARKYGGYFDAIACSNKGIVAVGTVLKSDGVDNGQIHSPITRLWLGDTILGRRLSSKYPAMNFNVWFLQLANGKLLSWSVPSVLEHSDLIYLLRPFKDYIANDFTMTKNSVHPKGAILGFTCLAGSSEMWMLQSSKGTRFDYVVGCVPMTLFGCVIGVGQNCKKLHRSLGEDFEKKMFRPDFLDHEIFSPSDFVLYPPAIVPSMYSLFHELATNRPYVKEEYNCIQLYLHNNCITSVRRYNLMMSLNLLTLRSIERIAALRKKRGLDHTTTTDATTKDVVEEYMHALLVDAFRAHTTNIQLAAMFLKFGRQLEPCTFVHLFPLPLSPTSNLRKAETMELLFSELLDHGTVRMTATALPLFSDKERTQAMCATLFDHCLTVLDLAFTSNERARFAIISEEKATARDVFCYALKLSSNDEESASDSDEDKAQIVHRSNKGGYLFCGLPRLFGARSTMNKDRTVLLNPLVLNGDGRRTITNGAMFSSSRHISHPRNVIAIASRYILSSVFECNEEDKHFCWRKVAAIASLLVDQNSDGIHTKNHKIVFSALHETLNERTQVDKLIRFLKLNIKECCNQVEITSASTLLDLVTSLLACATSNNMLLLDIEVPRLLLLSVILGHASDRIAEVLEDEPKDTVIWKAYLNVRFELSVLH